MVRRPQPHVGAPLLADVPEDKRFWCQDGRVFANLQELEAALPTLSAETWQHHTGQGHSDFTNWVRDVFGDDRLATNLHKAASPEAAARAIGARLVQHRRAAASRDRGPARHS
ncbi:MAG: hypothetical protein HYY01_14880 [Chloroflexi bacterium]|nr:hypothetical protein [Chloroflexota bacterium]